MSGELQAVAWPRPARGLSVVSSAVGDDARAQRRAPGLSLAGGQRRGDCGVNSRQRSSAAVITARS